MHLNMKFAAVALLALNGAIYAAPSLAFQEQTSGAAPSAPAASAPAQAATPAGSQSDKGNFATPSDAQGSGGGTEIHLPGLGKLGVLPKMDFGLELLYGATETKQIVDEPAKSDTTSDDDLRIRGTIKHQF